MKQVVIENPILSSLFEAPRCHFKFSEEGLTDGIVEARRISSCFHPVPRSTKRNPRQLAFETEWIAKRVQKNEFILICRGSARLR